MTIEKQIKYSDPLCWDDLADEYKQATGQNARVRPMDEIFQWAEKQVNKFYICPKEGTIHKIII